jgi:hypothetical protein
LEIAGNDVIHHLTKGGNSLLYISITLQNDITLSMMYEQFYVSDETDKYRLFVNVTAAGYQGKSER